MTEYTSMYRSNQVNADVSAVETLLSEVVPQDGLDSEDYPKQFEVDGDLVVHDDGETIHFASEYRMFNVWDANYTENVTEEFLERLSEHINERLVIRSVGFEGVKHIPDACQWVVDVNGPVRFEQLSE